MEYVCHIVALNGEILFSNYFEYVMLDSEIVRGKVSPLKITNIGPIINPEITKIFKTVIKYLNYTGPCNIDFKIINGLPQIFEINPRPGGSLMASKNRSVLANVLRTILKNAS